MSRDVNVHYQRIRYLSAANIAQSAAENVWLLNYVPGDSAAVATEYFEEFYRYVIWPWSTAPEWIRNIH
jgi:hypothetical protein